MKGKKKMKMMKLMVIFFINLADLDLTNVVVVVL